MFAVSGAKRGFGCDEGFRFRPPRVDARIESISTQSEVSKPLGQRLRDALDLDPTVGPKVVVLLEQRGPAAVCRLVVPVVIDAVDREVRPLGPPSRGSQSHVGEEIVEDIPALADMDASTAVIFPVLVLGVGAPVPHLAPRVVLSRQASISAVAVAESERGSVRSTPVYAVAPARLRPPTFEHGGVDLPLFAAFASADPLGARDRTSNDGPSAEPLAYQVDQSHRSSGSKRN